MTETFHLIEWSSTVSIKLIRIDWLYVGMLNCKQSRIWTPDKSLYPATTHTDSYIQKQMMTTMASVMSKLKQELRSVLGCMEVHRIIGVLWNVHPNLAS